jgi:predicted Zn-dependent protease
MPDLEPGSFLAFSVSGAWKHRNLTYALGKLSQSIAPSVCEAAIERALTTWTNAGVGLTFDKVADTEDHDIFIEWRRAGDPDLNMAGSTLAHADFPPGFSLIADGPPLPLHFDDEEHTWSDGAFEDEFDIETTCLHEIGHCLGLYHSKVPESIMFPTVSSNMTSRTLADDDVKGIRRLYKTSTSLPPHSSVGVYGVTASNVRL